MIEKGPYDWNNGLLTACTYGNLEIVELMIEKGANNWNDGFKNACIKGHLEIAKLMIKKGANNIHKCINNKAVPKFIRNYLRQNIYIKLE